MIIMKGVIGDYVGFGLKVGFFMLCIRRKDIGISRERERILK